MQHIIQQHSRETFLCTYFLYMFEPMNGYNGWIDSLNTIEYSVRFFPLYRLPTFRWQIMLLPHVISFPWKSSTSVDGVQRICCYPKIYNICIWWSQTIGKVNSPSLPTKTHTHTRKQSMLKYNMNLRLHKGQFQS